MYLDFVFIESWLVYEFFFVVILFSFDIRVKLIFLVYKGYIFFWVDFLVKLG